jgi:GNAT superfamily N-acetyltransferase
MLGGARLLVHVLSPQRRNPGAARHDARAGESLRPERPSRMPIPRRDSSPTKGDTPVGWISLGPREHFRKLERSPVMKPVDGGRVWSIVCFVVPGEHRGRGVAKALLKGAIAYARRRKVRILEAYPVDRSARSRDDALWFGTKSMFDAEGFGEVARRRPQRPVVRRILRR